MNTSGFLRALGYIAVAGAAMASPAPVQAENLLFNPSFEHPRANDGDFADMDTTAADYRGRWYTTEATGLIEVLNNFDGIEAWSGKQYLELLGRDFGEIHQSVGGLRTGGLYGLSFAHAGRNGIDTAQALVNQGGAQRLSINAVDNVGEWNFYRGTFRAQRSTGEVRFISIDPNSGDVGNLIDAVTLQLVADPAEMEEDLSAAFALQRNGLRQGLNDAYLSLDANCRRPTDEAPRETCVSISAHGTGEARNGPDTTGAALTFAVSRQLDDAWRVGGFLGQELKGQRARNSEYTQSIPTLGAFVENGNAFSPGLFLRGAVVTKSGDLSHNREDLARGSGSFDSWGAEARVAYGTAVGGSILLSPYAGLEYLQATRGAYSEDVVAYEVETGHYDEVQGHTTSLLTGVNLSGAGGENVFYQLGAGMGHVLSSARSDLSGRIGDVAFSGREANMGEGYYFGRAALTYAISPAGAVTLGVSADQTGGGETLLNYGLGLGYSF